MSSRTLPGSSGLPLVGETLPFLRDIKQFLDHRIAKYGPVFRTNILGAATAFSCDYASTLDVLIPTSQQPAHKLPLDAAEAYDEFMAPLYPSPNLLLSQDKHPLRTKATNQLHYLLTTNLSQYIPGIAQIVHSQIDVILASNTTSLRLYSFFKALTERTVTTIILGHLAEPDYLDIRKLCSEHFNGIIAAPVHVEAFGARTARATAVHAYNRIIDILESRLRNSINQPDDNDCVLSALAAELNADDHMDERISESAQLLLVLLSTAVPKALASALSSAVGIVSCESHAHIQQKIVEEAQVGKTETLDGVLMETLRMFPPLPGGMRQSNGATVGGRAVPKRWRVWYSALHSNRDEEVYKGAEEFLPERWSGVGEKAVGCPFARPGDDGKIATPLTFGAGERHCKGRDLAWVIMRESLTGLLENFEVVGQKGSESEMRFIPVLRSRVDAFVELKCRLRHS